MDLVNGQFDDADEDQLLEIQNQNSEQEDVDQDHENCTLRDNIHKEEECDDGDDDTLDAVEWNTQTSSITRQYMQFVGKISGGTNPQTKSFHESVMKKYQNNLNLDAYNPLVSKSFRKADDHVSKHKDKSDYATIEKALDKRTMMILYKMLNRVYTGIDGCISTGKEANVYHATEPSGRSLAVKVFKTVGSEFRNRDQYMAGEYRFRFNTCTKDIRKLVPKWAEKEFRNLHRIYKAGIPSPEPICLNNNVLVMEFLGGDGRPAPKLKDITLTSKQANQFYVDCINMMRKMFQDCKLVHADLSEFNLLVIHGGLYMIDVSQSVEMDNENALKFLKMDVRNVTSYFRRQGVKTMGHLRLIEFIMDAELKNTDEFIELAVQEVLDGVACDDDDVEVEVSRTLGEFESYGKDLRRIDDKRNLHQSVMFAKKLETLTVDDEDEDEDQGEGEDQGYDEDQGEAEDQGEEINKDKSKVDHVKFNRPKDESPESKKERKKTIKDIQRTNRQNKIPKSEKKRRIKVSKNKKN